MEHANHSYINPKLEARHFPQKGGSGIFAREAVQEGELLTMWGGQILTEEAYRLLPAERQNHGIQVWDFLYQVQLHPGTDPADFFNHSCNPNAGLNSPISLIALRDIHMDEEICFDYAMSDSSDYDQFICQCGAPQCRGKVTGQDWQIPELQKRYQGYFSPYLQQRINKMKQ
ncbi:MAG: SET domain-containing protein-lysine N-methyltransferase [Anaerolineaceae bacterium]|jgi:SET domain-containing protein|nr:SET domain-containing protein-lysine N-methyltransferase [Anaerolineaceae bacterium]